MLLLVILLLVLVLVLVARRALCRAPRAVVGGAAEPVLRARARRQPTARLLADVRREARAAAPGFAPVRKADRERLAAAVRRLTARHGWAPTADGLAAVRNGMLAEDAARAAGRAPDCDDVLEHLRGGKRVLQAARAAGVAPMQALRCADAAGVAVSQQDRDAAHREDVTSPPHMTRANARASRYEDDLGKCLRARGLEFWTEAEVREMYEAGPGPRGGHPAALAGVVRGDRGPGGPFATPDFLLKRPAWLEVPGEKRRRIHWVDAKNYPFVDSWLTRRSAKRQVAKYEAAFGPGALVYRGGVLHPRAFGRSAMVDDAQVC